MDFNIGEFIAELNLIQLVVFIVVLEILEILSGIMRAWKNNKPIQSAITRESIATKFETWKYVFALTALFLFVGHDDLAKMLLGFVLLPEITSIIENIVRLFMKENDNIDNKYSESYVGGGVGAKKIDFKGELNL